MAEEEKVVTGEGEITKDDKLWAMLSWIPYLGWIAALIVILSEDKKKRPFMKYHAVQALALGIVAGVITAVLSAVIVGCFIGLAWLVYAIILALKANKGEWVTVPVITDFCKKQNWI
jgi:uncharacterized membrane protein